MTEQKLSEWLQRYKIGDVAPDATIPEQEVWGYLPSVHMPELLKRVNALEVELARLQVLAKKQQAALLNIASVKRSEFEERPLFWGERMVNEASAALTQSAEAGEEQT